jgi:hypothetical protein
MPRAGLYLLFLALCTACGSTSTPPSAVPDGGAEWQMALARLSASGAAIYSFRFDGAPPAGTFYTVAVHDAPSAAACDRYGANVVETGSDFWLLEVTVNDAETGDHAVSVVERDGTPTPTANVSLLHRKNGEFVTAYSAVSGQLSISGAPSPQDARNGASLQGRVEADFPLRALQEVACMGGMERDGGNSFASCTCRAADGNTSTCTPTDGNNCCYDWTGPRTHVSIPLTAESCPNMCRWAAGLSVDYCQELLGQ